MIKQLRLQGFGSINNIQLVDSEIGKPQAGEVKIAVKASALNFDQLNYIAGVGPENRFDNAKNSSLLGYEASGVVLEVGADVHPDWIGKRVFPVGAFDVYRYGTQAEQAFVPADRLVEMPDNLDFVAATAVWVPFITAYGVLYAGQIQEGETLLVPAANSAVGLAAIQIAELVGAKVIAVVRSAENVEKLKQQGIQTVLNSSDETFEQQVSALTNGNGVDVMFDPIGGANLTKMAKLSANGGRIIEYGVLGGLQAEFPVVEVISKGLTIRGYTMNEIISHDKRFEQAKEFILAGLQTGKLIPKIAKTFPLTEYKKAYQMLTQQREMGRIVLQIAE